MRARRVHAAAAQRCAVRWLRWVVAPCASGSPRSLFLASSIHLNASETRLAASTAMKGAMFSQMSSKKKREKAQADFRATTNIDDPNASLDLEDSYTNTVDR
jgi:hypothetical protein